MKTTRDDIVKILRDFAVLVEQGVISEVNMHVRQGLGRTQHFDNGTIKKISNGSREVTISMRGFTFPDGMQDFAQYKDDRKLVNDIKSDRQTGKDIRAAQHTGTAMPSLPEPGSLQAITGKKL